MSTTLRIPARWPRARRGHRVEGRQRQDTEPVFSGRGERLLIRETIPGGGQIVLTNHALYVSEGNLPGRSWQQVGWGNVRAVGRSREARNHSVMTLRLRTPSPRSRTWVLPVQPRSRIPDLAAHLAAAAVVMSRRVMLSDSSVATFLARRDNATAGVIWTVERERVSDAADNAALQTEIAATLRRIRAQAGC